MIRALFLLLAPVILVSPAQAQTGGIQVAPVMVAMSSEHSIASVHMRNGRARPVSFEVDVFEWSQVNGEDVLTPSRDLIVAPGVFEIAPRGEQVVRLGVRVPEAQTERSYRLIMRELPTRREGNALGFTLEMSLPAFVSPAGARAAIETRVENRGAEQVLVMTNTGAAHAQISALDDMDGDAVHAPRYLLAGASAEIALPQSARTLRLRASESPGAQTERMIHVGARQNRSAALP